MANNTFALQVDEDNGSDNQIYIGEWPTIPFGNCQSAGTLGGTEACTYPVNSLGTVDALIGTNLKHHLYRVYIVFDEADVYQGTGASRTVRSKWGVITSGTSRLQKLAAHELGHALGFFDHIPGPGSLMYHTAPQYTLSVDDKWNLNRLYLHTTEAESACMTTVSLSHHDFNNARGRMYPASGWGVLNSASPVCPSTAYDGFAHYFKLDSTGVRYGKRFKRLV